MHPLTGKLINGTESFRWLTSVLDNSDGEISLCSAFLKIGALRKLAEHISERSSVRLLVRWKASDLLMGASDLECYEFATANGWKFYLKQDFHGKVYGVSGEGILVGSWNATASGFNLKADSNDEVGTLVAEDPYNLSVVEGFFSPATLVDDLLYSELAQFVEGHKGTSTATDFPEDLLQKLLPKSEDTNGFLLTECLLSKPHEILSEPMSAMTHIQSDLELLGVTADHRSPIALTDAFLRTKIFRWLFKKVQSSDSGLSFGAVTAELHNALLEDPKPYRSDVKQSVANLFAWIGFSGAESTGIEIIKPRHSEVLKLYQK